MMDKYRTYRRNRVHQRKVEETRHQAQQTHHPINRKTKTIKNILAESSSGQIGNIYQSHN